jgi:hypothetical protein
MTSQAVGVPKTTYILTDRDQVLTFLSTRPDPDQTITWTCPECNTINPDAYHAHTTRCSCGKGFFPAIPLPIVGDAKGSVKRAFMMARLDQIDDDIKECKSKRKGLEDEIAYEVGYINALEIEKRDIERELHRDRVESGEE